ncbi:MAG TPA: alpha-ketoglutarate-dependent dioxygenase AlkB [Verrucomicrobiae bacterium]|nr:alpha-ketoglutarate-dependent dioxygenase AlkB [Verrucomicrobiae bacterium]
MQRELFLDDKEATQQAFEIPGFSLRLNYVTPEEERDFIRHVDRGPWETDWRRRIQQYGLGYREEHGKRASWLRDLPDWLLPLAGRVANDAGFERFPENSVINEYIPPLGIGPHKDYGAFGPTIACVSLGSDIMMDFSHPERGLRVSVHLPARSLWAISGEARSEWRHAIAARLTDVINGERRPRGRRISITFRTAARNPNAA